MSAQAEDRRNWPFLPDLLYRMAEQFGLGTALAFGNRFGGRRIGLGKAPNPDHVVAREFGMPVLTWLFKCRREGVGVTGAQLCVPMGAAAAAAEKRASLQASIAEMTARNVAAHEIARALGIHARTVHAHRAKLREKARRAARVAPTRAPHPAAAKEPSR